MRQITWWMKAIEVFTGWKCNYITPDELRFVRKVGGKG
jgi:hypothetical protein